MYIVPYAEQMSCFIVLLISEGCSRLKKCLWIAQYSRNEISVRDVALAAGTDGMISDESHYSKVSMVFSCDRVPKSTHSASCSSGAVRTGIDSAQ